MLAGQHADYLVHALKAYKSGDRQNAIMNGQAAALSEQDMRDLAAYYAAQSAAIQTLERRSANSDG
jgi:cytochrome c553